MLSTGYGPSQVRAWDRPLRLAGSGVRGRRYGIGCLGLASKLLLIRSIWLWGRGWRVPDRLAVTLEPVRLRIVAEIRWRLRRVGHRTTCSKIHRWSCGLGQECPPGRPVIA